MDWGVIVILALATIGVLALLGGFISMLPFLILIVLVIIVLAFLWK